MHPKGTRGFTPLRSLPPTHNLRASGYADRSVSMTFLRREAGLNERLKVVDQPA